MTKLLSTDERMALNAAMGKLISGEEEGWFEAAQIVTKFGLSIPSGQHVIYNTLETPQGPSSSGYAAGIGNVSIHDEHESQKQLGIIQGIIERVGAYQISHYSDVNLIRFWDYRESALWQRTGPPATYVIMYEDSEPHTVGLALYSEDSNLTIRSIMRRVKMLVKYLPRMISQWTRGRPWRISSRSWTLAGIRVIHSLQPEFEDVDIIVFR
ncbi:hypothetical protein HYT05_04835 [Candidatus Kaiserbacteria bacterium]|nr:hypothetical protein [Candidatus Kaiserbacteria bacterium]